MIDQQCEDDDDEEVDCNYFNTRYEHLEEKFQEYKQSKEIEICGLQRDLERTKRQLNDKTQEKLDLLLKNQESFQNELLLRLFPTSTSIHTQTTEDVFQSTPDPLTKKRKLSPSPSSIHREYDYYS